MFYTDCSGIVLLGTEMEPRDVIPFLALPYPVVLLDAYFNTIPCNSVLINNEQGSYLAGRELLRCCQKEPGYLRSNLRISNFVQRSNGFFNSVRESGYNTSKCIIHDLTPSIDGAYNDMLEILKRGDDIAPGYFADNDLLALGALKAFKEMGYRIPEDVSIIGFDNLSISEVSDPPLSTIHVPKQYLGIEAVNRLMSLMKDPNQTPVKIQVLTYFLKRDSSKDY
ncbi:MAG: substrate-binding domain-containing protein [Erysipelotrichaceae bacterium]|nr:substrate-binding domain-containing protein [Erysipelotrichaceae bacterium]